MSNYISNNKPSRITKQFANQEQNPERPWRLSIPQYYPIKLYNQWHQKHHSSHGTQTQLPGFPTCGALPVPWYGASVLPVLLPRRARKTRKRRSREIIDVPWGPQDIKNSTPKSPGFFFVHRVDLTSHKCSLLNGSMCSLIGYFLEGFSASLLGLLEYRSLAWYIYIKF